MYWADKIAKEIVASGKYKPYWVDDMKTPSGRIHVGSLRGVVIHDLVFKALANAGKKATFTYVFDDHDAMDALPVYLQRQKWERFLGQPLFTVPSPEPGASSFAQYFAKEFEEVFQKIGCQPKIIWSSALYQTGQMNAAIRLSLDHASVIRQIYNQLYQKKIADDWYPFQVVCPNCGKEVTTRVTAWDGQEVTFTCQVSSVNYTRGCGFSGKISPFSGEGKFVGKLPWKVEWPVKWQVLGVTIEGAGKDHMSAGGSHDVAKLICQRVLDYPVPYPIPYEFFLVGGRKMSSSKGLGSSAREVAAILPPQILRFFLVRTLPMRAIDFDPGGWTVPDIFDEYDRMAKVWWDKGRKDNLGRIFELSQPSGRPPAKMFLPRFREVAMVVQMPNLDPAKYFSQAKGSALTASEKKVLAERMKYAKIWLSGYAPEEAVFSFAEELPQATKKLSAAQKEYLGKVAGMLGKARSAQALEKQMYQVLQEMKLPALQGFAAVYTALLGKTFGPKAAWLIFSDRQFAKKRFLETSK